MEIYTYAILPKIGSEGLAIHVKYRISEWKFSEEVVKIMRKYDIDECWFQQFEVTNKKAHWMWSHGIIKLINNEAIITQIG